MMGCYDSFSTIAPDSEESTAANTSIEHIHQLYANGTREISEELIVEGTVTANDQYGNFYKSFIIEKDGYAIEVLDGLYDSYVRHPIGGSITLKLKGLGLDRYLGILRCGLVAPATSSYSLDYMTNEAVVDLYVEVAGFLTPLAAQARTIGELDQEKAGELIKVEALKLHTEDGVERTWSEYALFRNSDLDTLWCYTSPYSDFANSKIPQGEEVSLCGILEFGSTDSYSDQFIIKLRGEEDCIY